VYQAKSTWTTLPTGLTPPSSPATSSRLLAVKVPLRRDAHAVLAAEALILEQITASRNTDRHVVPFHGFELATHSIVMSAVPLSLSTYIEDRSAMSRQTFSTRTMFDPVLTMPSWRELAVQLIDGLSWLHHGAGVVHGDIKPHNILLRARDNEDNASNDSSAFPYEALYADFSSAHDVSTPKTELHGTAPLSALTPPFAAPELLTITALKSTDTLATPASDVFSLALTLLAAATGDLLLYPGTSSMQRLAMSREGHRVLDFIRSGPHGSRIPRKGLVEQLVRPAVAQDPNERVDSSTWLHILDS
jgi:serine/threonine protein kinase